jgi:hypothetical protein
MSTTPLWADIPLACAADAIPRERRAAHFALIARLFGADVRERVAAPDGYSYRFDGAAFDDIARFVADERLCCPFLTFDIELHPQGGPLWLHLTGPEGTRAFLDAELSH